MSIFTQYFFNVLAIFRGWFCYNNLDVGETALRLSIHNVIVIRKHCRMNFSFRRETLHTFQESKALQGCLRSLVTNAKKFTRGYYSYLLIN